MIYDVILYNGERELFEIRYNILKDYVDEFIVCEATTTFSGKPKPLHYAELIGKYKRVQFHKIDENWSSEEIALAYSSPNTEYGKGASHWVREFLQKEGIKKSLKHLKDDDVIFIGDCDEIWNPLANVLNDKKDIYKIKQLVYTYYLNNYSSENWFGTLRTPYYQIKDKCLNHIRTSISTGSYMNHGKEGWHFTSMGGYDGLFKKLSDSYTDQSYFTSDVAANLKENIETNRDFLGRNFIYTFDESCWPQYLKDNREQYAHLLKTGDNR